MKLLEFLQSSTARPAFVKAVHDFLATGHANDRVVFSPGSPPIKIERTLSKVLETFADAPIESVRISGRSGCEYFRGELIIGMAEEELHVGFDWDCRWRAQEQGWSDYFGLPDQIRAAREFGYDCFRQWEVRSPSTDAAA